MHADYTRDFEISAWLPKLAGIEAVVNAVGILREVGAQTFEALHVKAPIALFEACAIAGVRKVIQISALGADQSAASRYHISKKKADDYLASLSLDWVVVQPSLVFGEGGTSARLFTTLAVLPLTPLPDRGQQLVQPVHVDDLTAAIVALIEADSCSRQRVPLVGPRALTFREMLAELRIALGLAPAIFVRVPLGLVKFAAILGEINPHALLDRETLAMLLRGNVGSRAAIEQLLDRSPRGVPQFVAPESARSVSTEARLNWLLPILRASIALTWIVTGILSLGVYPVAESYALLARLGITGAAAPIFLYGAALLDLAFGVGVYLVKDRRWLWRAQMLLIAGYSVLIAIFLPEFWLHPFGPLLKNIPLLAAILLLHELER